MIKLYNNSKIPDNLILPVLQYAFRKTRCHGDVVVKVTRGGIHTRSKAERAFSVARWFLSRRSRTKADKLRTGWVKTNGGYVILQPLLDTHLDPILMATSIMDTAIHEFVHIKDFQTGKRFAEYNRNWRNRPHEMRAMMGTRDIVNDPDMKYQDLVLNLGVWLENNR